MKMQKIIGIYKIINKINNKIYIGASINVFFRITQHKFDLRHNQHSNKHLQNAWNKYKETNFIFSILETCSTSNLVIREQYWMDVYQSCNRNFGYNIQPLSGWRKHAEETKKKIGNANKLALKGYKHNKEFCEKISKSRQGIKKSEQTKQKISKNHALYWLGKTLSERHKKKIGDKLRGKKKQFPEGYWTNERRDKYKLTQKKKFKKVYQFNKFTGEFISKYDCINDAARIINIDDRNIRDVCKGKRPSVRGYIWKTEGDLIKINRNIPNLTKFNLFNYIVSPFKCKKISNIKRKNK